VNIHGPFILSVETSCDDTSVALVNSSGFVRDQIQVSQDNRHIIFGGVVPEVASRAHTETLLLLIHRILNQNQMKIEDLEGFAVTNRPGLLGSLLVGVVSVKALAQATQKPFIGVNHLIGHIAAPLLTDQKMIESSNGLVTQDLPPFPWLVLAVSGGHTTLYKVEKIGSYQVLGTTRDDAAGEAFDKFAKMAGIGFPGGSLVDKLASQVTHYDLGLELPVTNLPGFDFSFSGLKSAADRLFKTRQWDDSSLKQLAYLFQKSVVDALLIKLERAFDYVGAQTVMVTGGVSANSRLRTEVESWARQKKVVLRIPPLRYCTDNAAMIGLAAWWSWEKRVIIDSKLNIYNPSPESESHDFTNGY
jgi:N6-L-threonylcarbamoyladenine synthase